MGTSVSAPKVQQGIRPGVDETKSRWVFFPHCAGSYLLPAIKKSRKIFPVFCDDGSVGIDTEEPNEELGKLVDGFLIAHAGFGAERTLLPENLVAFYKLLKELIVTNYDLQPETLRKIMSMTEAQLGQFFSIIYTHCNEA